MNATVARQIEAGMHAQLIAQLNDRLRKTMAPCYGKIVMAGSLAQEDPELQVIAARKVRMFDEFTRDNDPHGEHDFGTVQLKGRPVYWKIDYFEKGTGWNFGSEFPEDDSKTDRMLTIMYASDY